MNIRLTSRLLIIIRTLILLIGLFCSGFSFNLAPSNYEVRTITDKKGKTYVLNFVTNKDHTFVFVEQDKPLDYTQKPDEEFEWYYKNDLLKNELFAESFKIGFTNRTVAYISYFTRPSRHELFSTYEITHIDVHCSMRDRGIFSQLLMNLSSRWEPGTRLIINNIEHEETFETLTDPQNKNLKKALSKTLFGTVLRKSGFKIQKVKNTWYKEYGDIYDVFAILKPNEISFNKTEFGIRLNSIFRNIAMLARSG